MQDTHSENTLNFHFMEQDIVRAQRLGAGAELLSLLALCTGSLWRMDRVGIAQEVLAPFRSARFLVEVNGEWQTYQDTMPLPLRVCAEIEAGFSAGLPTSSQDESFQELSNPFDLPQECLAHQVYRFLESRLGIGEPRDALSKGYEVK